MSTAKSIILAFRPKTLTAALVPCVAATALAYHNGSAQWDIFIYALLASFFIQIGTNLVNDAVDFKKGADTEKRIGPTRVTQAGLLKSHQVMAIGNLFFVAALFCGIPLVIHGGWSIVIIGLLSVLMGYAYTAGPFPLAYLGLGEVFVILFFGLVAVMGLYFLHTGGWSVDSFILGLQIGIHATALIAINNLRDIHGDILAHKKTLAVRFGLRFGRCEIITLCFFPFVLSLYWAQRNMIWAAILPVPTLFLALKISKQIAVTQPSPVYNKFLAQSAGLHLTFGLLTSVGIVLS